METDQLVLLGVSTQKHVDVLWSPSRMSGMRFAVIMMPVTCIAACARVTGECSFPRVPTRLSTAFSYHVGVETDDPSARSHIFFCGALRTSEGPGSLSFYMVANQ